MGIDLITRSDLVPDGGFGREDITIVFFFHPPSLFLAGKHTRSILSHFSTLPSRIGQRTEGADPRGKARRR